MSIHQHDENMRPDLEFIKGQLEYLVIGNKCRLLDGRRTPGVIEDYFDDCAMFRWRITNFEDKGKYWDVPAENIVNYQFEKDASILDEKEVEHIKTKIKFFKNQLHIEIDYIELINTNLLISQTKNDIVDWLKTNSLFFEHENKINFNSTNGSKLLAQDLENYMKSQSLLEMENQTARMMVLNPNSGEWIKGLKIVLAEMGLVEYNGKIPRDKNIFNAMGSKENRKRYIIHRLAFIRAYFSLLNIEEVIIYRGMAGEEDFKIIPRSLLSCTYNLNVAKSFCDNMDNKYRISYLLKMTIPIDKIFMSYIETDEMNKQYKEAEVILLYNQKIEI